MILGLIPLMPTYCLVERVNSRERSDRRYDTVNPYAYYLALSALDQNRRQRSAARARMMRKPLAADRSDRQSRPLRSRLSRV